MEKYILFLLTVVLVAASNVGAVAATTAEDDDDLAQRREAMAQVVLFARPSWRHPRTTDPETIHRLAMFLRREMGPIETIFRAVRKMPESSAKDEAFDAAMEVLTRHLRLLLPHGCAACATSDNDAGFALSNMTESSASEFLSKEQTRGKAKELLNRHLDGEAL